MVSAVVLTGAPGTGKSSVLEALATRLEIEGIAHGAIESEELGRGAPALTALRWIEALAAVLKLQRDSGRRLFLIAATTETGEELSGVLAAACADRSLVVCLTAAAEVVATRLQRREPDRWPGKRGLIEHARALVATIPRLGGMRSDDRHERARREGCRARGVRADACPRVPRELTSGGQRSPCNTASTLCPSGSSTKAP
jgi:gluconate kinase